MRKEVSMNTSQMLALVARVESLAAENALYNEENHRLCVQVIGLHKSIDDLKREIEALNKDLQYERSISGRISEELSNFKSLLCAEPVTVQLPNPEILDFKVPLIKLVRQFATKMSGDKMGLRDAKDAVDYQWKVILPAAIIPDYEKMISQKGKV
jgi:hypothetical protein